MILNKFCLKDFFRKIRFSRHFCNIVVQFLFICSVDPEREQQSGVFRARRSVHHGPRFRLRPRQELLQANERQGAVHKCRRILPHQPQGNFSRVTP